MAMKTPTKTSTETTAETTATDLAPATGGALAALSGLNLFNIPAPSQSADLFPAIKIPYPIEADGQKFQMADVFKAGLWDGTKFSPLPTPYVLSVIAAREATRKLAQNEKGEKNYERAYKPMGAGFDGSAPLFEQHLQDPMAERGVSYVVAVITSTGTALAEVPAFKVMKDYWGLALHQALSSNGMGVTVKIADHSGCQTPSKKNPTMRYLDPKKFNSPANVVVAPLTPEQLQSVATTLEAQKDKFLAWCKR